MKSGVIQEYVATHSELQIQGAHYINYGGAHRAVFDSDAFLFLFFSLKPQVEIKMPPVVRI